MVHASRAPLGGLAFGVGAFGSAIWIQREPRCHRWHVLRTHLPPAPASCGDDWGFGTGGVREPRRPTPAGGTDAIALAPQQD